MITNHPIIYIYVILFIVKMITNYKLARMLIWISLMVFMKHQTMLLKVTSSVKTITKKKGETITLDPENDHARR